MSQLMPAMEFGKKMSVEKELSRVEAIQSSNMGKKYIVIIQKRSWFKQLFDMELRICFVNFAFCLVYDESGNFLIYSSLMGIKFVNLKTQKVSRLIGKREHIRPLAIALFQVPW